MDIGETTVAVAAKQRSVDLLEPINTMTHGEQICLDCPGRLGWLGWLGWLGVLITLAGHLGGIGGAQQ